MIRNWLASLTLGVVIGLTAVAVSVAAAWRVGDPDSEPATVTPPLGIGSGEVEFREPSAEEVRRVESFCGDCHSVPNPKSFPRDRWPEEIKRGYEFYARSGRQDLDPPPPETTLAYYLARSAANPQFAPAPAAAPSSSGVTFRVERRSVPPQATLPEVSTMVWTPLQRGGRPMLVAGDMKFGQIVAIDPNDANAAPIILARLDHPGRIVPVQFGEDGSTTFLVADLGSYMPTEERRGRVVLLRRPAGADAFETITLASGFTRVVDVQPADFDGDGRIDLVVSEFGWQESGGIWLLHNITEGGGEPTFRRERVDDRAGVVRVPVHDFDDDGRPDFAAIVSQEYEAVDLFLNREADATMSGSLAEEGIASPIRFSRRGAWAGPDLTFGSSGLELADLNGNGLTDLVVTNGDSWDNLLATPGHGVHWLENSGGMSFRHHRLASLPGAYATAVFDADGDGDADIVAVSWLPHDVEPAEVAGGRLGSIVLLEQVEPGRFEPRLLESGSPFYATVVSGDFDDDGDIDFAVASGPMVARGRVEKFYLAIWWNESAAGPRVDARGAFPIVP